MSYGGQKLRKLSLNLQWYLHVKKKVQLKVQIYLHRIYYIKMYKEIYDQAFFFDNFQFLHPKSVTSQSVQSFHIIQIEIVIRFRCGPKAHHQNSVRKLIVSCG